MKGKIGRERTQRSRKVAQRSREIGSIEGERRRTRTQFERKSIFLFLKIFLFSQYEYV